MLTTGFPRCDPYQYIFGIWVGSLFARYWLIKKTESHIFCVSFVIHLHIAQIMFAWNISNNFNTCIIPIGVQKLAFYSLYTNHIFPSGPEDIPLFTCSTQLSMKFIMLINVKMPTIVGILTFISIINTTSERLKARNFFICQYCSFYEQLNSRAQLSWAWKKFYNLEPGFIQWSWDGTLYISRGHRVEFLLS